MSWRNWTRFAGTACITIILQACQSSSRLPAQEPQQVAGFSTPESVLHDTARDVYLVSNIDGSPVEKDDNGFISRVSPDGRVLEKKWIDGASPRVTLNAPKGMAIAGDRLYIADIDAVRVFNVADGAQLLDVEVPGSTFLNDVTALPDGSVVVSDSGLTLKDGGFAPTGTDALVRIDPAGNVTRLVAGPEMGKPNGVASVGDEIWVVYFGSDKLDAFDTSGTRRRQFTLPAGQLDGIVDIGDHEFLVSSWETQTVYRVDVTEGPALAITTLATGLKAPADIGWDDRRRRLLVPLFESNEVTLLDAEP